MISNYIERAKRDERIVGLCDAGEAYAVIGRQFGLTGSTVTQIYHKACRKRARGKGISYTREGLLATKGETTGR